ncbi:amino acid ABC transporter substrate-binding protein, partial [Serratia nematodiphila DZ0503SBS1]
AGVTTQTYAADNLLQQVKQRGTLIVGLEGTYPPFSFQGEDGKLTGFEVDFANALAQHLGVTEHRSMYSYVRLSIDRCTATYV